MKKVLVSVLIIINILAISVFADTMYKVFVDDKPVKDSSSVNIVDDKVMIDLNSIKDQLGLTVDYNENDKTLNIYNIDKQLCKSRSESLQKVLRMFGPDTAKKAVTLWAEGVKSRNGAMQYAALNDALKKQFEKDYEGTAWVTGASSPWVENYSITKLQKQKDNSYAATVVFRMVAVGINELDKNNLIIKNYGGNKWYITSIKNVK